MARTILLLLLGLFTVPSVLSGAGMQSNAPNRGQTLDVRIGQLESETARLRSQVDQHDQTLRELGSTIRQLADNGGFAFVLFGAFCALWAQNTGRSAWGWFFLGLFFNVITVLVLLSKNSRDAKTKVPAAPGMT